MCLMPASGRFCIWSVTFTPPLIVPVTRPNTRAPDFEASATIGFAFALLYTVAGIPIARLADRISAVFVPIVLVIAVVTFLAWLAFSGDLHSAFRAAVAVLVIACPCALGLATPVGLLAGTGRASQLGILIRGPEALEDTRTVDTVVLDKTGTVTEGNLAVTGITPLNGDRKSVV